MKEQSYKFGKVKGKGTPSMLLFERRKITGSEKLECKLLNHQHLNRITE